MTGRHELVQTQHVHHLVHGRGMAGRFNARLAVGITRVVGTMPAAYVFAALALVSLPAALASRSTVVIVGWIAQTFLQLVLLPIIIVGQNVQAKASDARAETDHETLVRLDKVNEQQLTILNQQNAILALLKSKAR